MGVATASMIRRGAIIESAAQIAKEAEADMAISVAPTRIKTVLKQELRLSYRRTRTTPPQANTQRCLVLR